MELARATGSDPIRVLVADSNEVGRQLLVSALRRHSDFRILSCKFEFDAIQGTLAESGADVTVINVQTPDPGDRGLGGIRRLSLTHPEVSQVLLLDTYNQDLVVNAFRSGAKGLFCLTEHPFRMLCKCIHRVHDGQ